MTALRGNRVIQLALLRARPCAVTMTPAPFPQCCPRPGSTCGDTSCPRQSSLASSGLPTGQRRPEGPSGLRLLLICVTVLSKAPFKGQMPSPSVWPVP